MSSETISGFLTALSMLIPIVMLKLLMGWGIFRHRRLLSGDGQPRSVRWLGAGTIRTLEPVTRVTIAMTGNSQKALTRALASLPPTVERLAIRSWEAPRLPAPYGTQLGTPTPNVPPWPEVAPWGFNVENYPHELDDLTYVYLRPMQPTRYRRWVEPVRVRDRRLLRDAAAEVEQLLA